jgi:CDP-diacylglycerol--glycerol-3-phosphate 3-phosphatidyltransferase
MIPAFVALYLIKFPFHDVIATGVFILASFTDFLDGYIARKYNMVTDLGKFLDPVADKVLVMSALVLLSVEFMNFNNSVLGSVFNGAIGIVIVVSTIIILAREFIITGFRTIAAKKNLVLAADKIGKMKTVMQMISIIALLLTNFAFSLYTAPKEGSYAQFPMFGVLVFMIGLVALVFAVFLTVLSAVNYIVKNRSVLKEDNK